MALGIWDYIRELKDKYKIFTNKQKKFLSHIAIYTKDLEVYKVIIWKDKRKKNGKRVGVVDDIKIYEKGKNKAHGGTFGSGSFGSSETTGHEIIYPKLKKELEGSDGYKIFIYDTKMDTVNCYEGEETQPPGVIFQYTANKDVKLLVI